MKTTIKLNYLISMVFVILFLSSPMIYGQLPSSDFPNITKDLVPETRDFYAIKHRLSLPGVWGLGGYASYTIPHIIHASAEAGFGWVIGKHEEDFDKKWRPWFEVKVGYPFLKLQTKKKGRWVTRQYSSGGKDYEKFYKITVPRRHLFTLEATYTSNPTNDDINRVATGPAASYSFNAPSFGLGVSYKAYSKADVSVKDSKTGKIETGSIQSLLEIYVGILFPTKEQIDPPNAEWRGINKIESFGYVFLLRIPTKLNGFGTFDIGLVSTGYETGGQIYLGNTIYF